MPAVSLDTNVFLLVLRGVDSFAGTLLRNLPRFAVCIPAKVGRVASVGGPSSGDAG